MTILVRSLHPAGEYSRVLVVPKQWLMAQGQPRAVTVEVGRKRLVIRPVEREGASNGKQ